jgi:hypothetical protein
MVHINNIIFPCKIKILNKEKILKKYNINYYIILKNNMYYHYYYDDIIKFNRKTNIFNLKEEIIIIKIDFNKKTKSINIKNLMNKIEQKSDGKLIIISRKDKRKKIIIKMIFIGIISNKINDIIDKFNLVISFKIYERKIYKELKKRCNIKNLKRIENNNYIFKTKEECVKNRLYHRYNNKYKNFRQFIYTAGDWDDINKHILKRKEVLNKEESYKFSLSKIIKENIFYNSKDKEINKNKELITNLLKHKLYKNIDDKSMMNTLKYMFYKIRNGIFIKIKNNELKMYIPFHNTKYNNDWNYLIKMDKEDIIKYNNKKNNNFNREYKMKYNKKEWVGDNCIINTSKYRNYKLVNAGAFYVMLKELCDKKIVPDVEFFYNHRDYPILKKDLTEPYIDIVNDENIVLKSHKYEKYMPIVNTCKRENYLDILIPTSDDWEIVNKTINIGLCRDVYINFKHPKISWDEKIPTAIFRGAATNCGYDEYTSPRIKAHMLSKEWETNSNYNENNKIDGIKFLDAGVTYIWYDDIKKKGENKINFIKSFETIGYVPMDDQAKYKYILNIDGSVTAYRLALELSYNSCILKVKSEYFTWYSHLLKEYEHYIPIKEDLSDLAEKIEWCKKNDKECKKIAENAKVFYEKHFTKKMILDYLQMVITEISKK